MEISKNEIFEKILYLLDRYSSVKKEDIYFDSILDEDLGLDSLDTEMLLVDLEREYDILFHDTFFHDARTVGIIIKICQELIYLKGSKNEK